ncbi:QCR6 subunit6 of the ubiquinol cytochrome-c reductase complex [Moniliophthora roreri]|nr:QCR6 subunit6 of the ubiquinol cytochrome-c reductase complex [Moniliophthora roreri]
MPGAPGLELTIGAAFIGGVIQIFLFAVASVQTFIFFKANSETHHVNKWMVFLLWLLAVLHVVSVIHVIFFYLVTSGGKIDGPLVWSYVSETSLEVGGVWDGSNCKLTTFQLLLTNLTQILYAMRLWQLMRGIVQRLILFTALGCLIGLNLGESALYHFPGDIPLRVSQVPTIGGLSNVDFAWAVKLDFSATSLIDFILSIALVHNLAKPGKRLDWTDKSLDVILAYALNTGILASFFSLTCPIVYSLMPDNLVFLCLRIILTGLYVNSLLAMLNARYYFQKSDDLSTGPINAPSQTSVLVYNGRGFNRQLHSTASSSSNKATINEIGLPLFQPREERNKVDSSIQLMEVKVTKDRLDVA